MDERPLLETYWGGFEANTSRPYFWLRTPRVYFDTYLFGLSSTSRNWEWVPEYLGHRSDFALRDGRFGFGRVGRVEKVGNDEVVMRFYLQDRRYTRRTLLTLRYVLDRLNLSRYEDSDWVHTQKQQVMEWQIETSRISKGHCLGGEIFPQAVRVLTDGEFGQTHSNTNDAMQRAWCCVAPREYARYSDACGMRFHDDGRPELTCFGYGISSGVLPNHGETSWHISSDNVDVAYQELVLLAGWFKLSHALRNRLHGLR